MSDERRPVTVYECRDCGARRHITGQRPLSPEPRIRTGCDACGRIRTWTPQGVPG